ncbi:MULTISPECIES: hypothetical protein [unclassified Caballeronia]|jgi:hypothetical protein|uniref:hypothetical protein n=1 Tax=unclassified Caballeronia TaxID=2646786 RepID=UPI0020294FC7|nr:MULTISPECIES: hypothetical protein [unclassified Caballeronia]MDR5768908.1 hypothetical protein [Caballeronia sp. LZ028]MDR5797670.1 hypothetical protein [Caballeronia sp. LZ008]
MAIAADRISDTEVKVGEIIYSFDTKVTADGFQQCLGSDSVETCAKNHAPVSTRAVADESGAPKGEPGSIISPSLGGMP